MGVPTCLRGEMPFAYRSSMLVWPNLLWQTSREERKRHAQLLSLVGRMLISSHTRVSHNTYQHGCFSGEARGCSAPPPPPPHNKVALSPPINFRLSYSLKQSSTKQIYKSTGVFHPKLTVQLQHVVFKTHQ